MTTIYWVIDAQGTYANNNPHYSLSSAKRYAAKIGGEVSEDTEDVPDEDGE
jgi:hypothetical protein